MGGQSNLITWLAIGVIAIGIAAIVAISAQSTPELEALPTKVVSLATATPEPPTSTPTPIPTVALPTPTSTPIPLQLPDVPPPPGGQVLLLTPVAAGMVGWSQSDDVRPNYFGDFNIYAGFYDGQVRVGAFQFDLSAVAPGTPILHADLTLMGLSAGLRGGLFGLPVESWRSGARPAEHGLFPAGGAAAAGGAHLQRPGLLSGGGAGERSQQPLCLGQRLWRRVAQPAPAAAHRGRACARSPAAVAHPQAGDRAAARG
ncbi:MAG: hypothetical protein DCC57_18170 [Chloroflexi bacterium]|nr:MAG: hypothetical protein DCC57_18170 [Chloroflexota bacterium]